MFTFALQFISHYVKVLWFFFILLFPSKFYCSIFYKLDDKEWAKNSYNCFILLFVCVCDKNIPIGNWNSDLLMHFSNIFSYLGDPISKRTT